MKNFLKVCFLLVALFLGGSCTHVFFQPDRYLYARPERLGLEYQNIIFESFDKTRLHSWFFPAQLGKGKNKGLVTLFHGNAQNLSSHYLSVSWLTRYGYDVWVWDYRGYGLSQGEASSKGIAGDAKVALNKAWELFQKKSYEKFIFVGQSLGGNILMRSIADFDHRSKVDLLILDSTFLSYEDIAFDRLTSHWLTWLFSPLAFPLVSDRYSAEAVVQSINIPALVMHGKKDPVVPFQFGEEVYKRLGSEKKWFWPQEDGKHIDSLGQGKGKLSEKLVNFIETL